MFYLHICLYTRYISGAQRPEEGKHQVLWDWSYRQLWVIMLSVKN